jgi:hypothetical protein
VSGALPTNSCHGAKGRHVCAVKLNGADHQLNQNRIRALHGFLAIETGGPGFPSRTSDVKRNGGRVRGATGTCWGVHSCRKT